MRDARLRASRESLDKRGHKSVCLSAFDFQEARVHCSSLQYMMHFEALLLSFPPLIAHHSARSSALKSVLSFIH